MGSFYDSAPGIFPAGTTEVALYHNGLYAFPKSQVKPSWRVRWIDVFGDAPAACSILDIETGDASSGSIRAWCDARDTVIQNSRFRLYCNLSTWPEVRSVVRSELTADQRLRVRYWIANPTGIPHLVPGSSATQYLWGAEWDESLYNNTWESPT
jgi:hypothetical protein